VTDWRDGLRHLRIHAVGDAPRRIGPSVARSEAISFGSSEKAACGRDSRPSGDLAQEPAIG